MIPKQHLKEIIKKAQIDYGKTLYHYTSIQALKGILENKEFWLGNARNMNDKSELIDFINRICDAVLLVEDPNAPCVIETINKIKQFENIDYPFVMCLSHFRSRTSPELERTFEDASMWERYADNAQGVCIKFDLKTFYELFYGEGFFVIDCMFYKYDAKEHELVEAISNYIHGKPYGFNSLEGLISNIQSCAVCHKHHSFCKEDEIRLTYFEDNPQKEYIFSGGIIKSIYKVNVGGLCQEKNINFEDLFQEIIIGPRSKQNKADLVGYLKLNKYNILANHIKESNCPLR